MRVFGETGFSELCQLHLLLSVRADSGSVCRFLLHINKATRFLLVQANGAEAALCSLDGKTPAA
jgi:hypothetical protein